MLHFLVLITFSFLPIFLKAQLSGKVDCQEISLQADIIPACNLGVDGKVSLRISNGLPPYQVNWDDGNQRLNRKVPAGNYEVTVTDALGCTVSSQVNVQKYPEFYATAVVKNTTRSDKSNGSIQVNVTGGSPPYHYSWIANNGSSLPEASTDARQVNKLGSGTYKIVIFDASGCYTELETEVN